MDQRIDLAPNCSLTDASASLHYASICAISLPLAVLFAWSGYWPVLLFWMIEMQLVTRSARGELTQEFARHWARVRLRSPRTRLGSSLLTIESHGRACVIGSFLTDEERARLAARLRAMVAGQEFYRRDLKSR